LKFNDPIEKFYDIERVLFGPLQPFSKGRIKMESAPFAGMKYVTSLSKRYL
jgi:hypothetical protein